MKKNIIKSLLENLFVALLYATMCYAGQAFAIEPGNVTAVFLPSGIALAFLMIFKHKVHIGIFIGAFIGNAWAFFDFSSSSAIIRSLSAGMLISFGSVLQAFVGASILTKVIDYEKPFAKLKDVALFTPIEIGVVIISSTIGTLSLSALGFIPFSSFPITWTTWWLGDYGGVLIATPTILLVRYVFKSKPKIRVALILESIAFFLSVSLATLLHFLVSSSIFEGIPVFILYIPLLLWGVIRMGRLGAFLYSTGVCTVSIHATVNRVGLFVNEDINISLLSLIGFITTVCVGSFAFAAVLREQKESEEKHLESIRLLETLIETMPMPFFYKDREGKHLGCNKAFLELYDIPKEDIIGKTTEEFFKRDSAKEAHRKDLEFMKKGGAWVYTDVTKCKDGNWHTLVYNKATFNSPNGSIGGMLGVLNDITEIKRIEQELKQIKGNLEKSVEEKTRDLKETNDRLREEIDVRKTVERSLEEYTAELKRSNRDLEQFAYIASHDLREPLRTIASYVQLLEKRYKNSFDSEGEQFLSYVVNASLRMNALIQGLLRYSKIGRDDERFSPIKTNALLKDTITLLKHKIDSNEVQISFENLPDILGNANLIGEVFQNLIENAIKFRKKEEPVIINITAEDAEDGFTRFSVEDNGIGFDMKFSDKIFSIFQRLHTQTKYEGTGIGLALCKKIIEEHGGKIDVKSEEGVGSTFYFTLHTYKS